MRIKEFLTRLVEKWTGRKCSRCRYNCAGHCTHPSDGMYMKCWHSLTRPGYTGRYERPAHWEKDAEPAQQHHELTQEEQHQLDKIKATLAEAGETARDGGLLED